jgi:RNA polymerase sigma-70 factor (ECF subfamily)
MKIPMKTDELFRNHAAFVARFLSRLGVSSDELDDAVQEVFLVVHRNGGYTPGPATPTSYLASIAIRAAANHRRRGRKSRERRAEVAPDETSSPNQDPARSLETHESLEQLQEALDVLEPTLKATLVLAELEGENCKAIAATFRIPVGTVYWRLHRARKEFRVALASHALSRESRVHDGGRPARYAALGSILFARSAAGRAIEAARAHSVAYDVGAAFSRFQALLRAGASVPSWAPAALAAGAGTSLGLTSPAILSAVVAVHVLGMGVTHGPLDGKRGNAGMGVERPSATSSPVLASLVDRPAFEPASVAAPVLPALLVEPQPDPPANADVAPPHRAFEKTREPTRATMTRPREPQAAPAPDASAENEVREIQDVSSAERLLATSPAEALAFVQASDARSTGGYLREERRYIAVLALVALGRVDEARAQAASFLQDYPDGPYAQRVRAALVRSGAH